MWIFTCFEKILFHHFFLKWLFSNWGTQNHKRVCTTLYNDCLNNRQFLNIFSLLIMLLNIIKTKCWNNSCIGVNKLIAKSMSQVFHFTVFQEYSKFSLGGLQKQIQANSKIPESLWCTSHLHYHKCSSTLVALWVFGNCWIIKSAHSYSRWNYYCSKPKKKWSEIYHRENWCGFCKIFYRFPPSACSFISLTATLVESSLVAVVFKGTISFISARNKSHKKGD